MYRIYILCSCCTPHKLEQIIIVLKVHISANTRTELHITGIFQRNICVFWNYSPSTAVSNFSDSNLSTCHPSFLQIADLKRTEPKWQRRETTPRLPVTDGPRVDGFYGNPAATQETGEPQPHRRWLTVSLTGRRQRGGFSIFLRPRWRI